MSTLATNAITDASGGNTATINSYTPTESNMAGRNRIINGDMRIDQRNAGASVTGGVGYTFPVDRFKFYSSAASKLSGQRSTTAPTDFTNSLLMTSLAATTPAAGDEYQLYHMIEGFNIADFGWGTASAQTVTVSFWVRSSLTGTFSGAVNNFGGTRSYVFTYAISAANTFEYKTITIPGDTTGTWETGSSMGLQVLWDLGSGSNFNGTAGAWASGFDSRTSGAVSLNGTSGATFYITGVQLEVGSVATPFERRQYGQELALCQRYCYVVRAASGSNPQPISGWWDTTTGNRGALIFPTTMRATPSLIFSSLSDVQALQINVAWNVTTAIALTSETSPFGAGIAATSTGGTTAHPSAIRISNNGFIGFTAEL